MTDIHKISRRSFLKLAGLTAAGATLAACSRELGTAPAGPTPTSELSSLSELTAESSVTIVQTPQVGESRKASDLPVGTILETGEIVPPPPLSEPSPLTAGSATVTEFTRLVPFQRDDLPVGLTINSANLELNGGIAGHKINDENLYFFSNGDIGEKNDDFRWGLVFVVADEKNNYYAAIADTYQGADGAQLIADYPSYWDAQEGGGIKLRPNVEYSLILIDSPSELGIIWQGEIPKVVRRPIPVANQPDQKDTQMVYTEQLSNINDGSWSVIDGTNIKAISGLFLSRLNSDGLIDSNGIAVQEYFIYDQNENQYKLTTS